MQDRVSSTRSAEMLAEFILARKTSIEAFNRASRSQSIPGLLNEFDMDEAREDPLFHNPTAKPSPAHEIVRILSMKHRDDPDLSNETAMPSEDEVRKYIQQLGIFIPERLIRHYIQADQREVKKTCFFEEFEAAVLFVDISGFSFLAETLERGKRLSLATKQLSDEVGLAFGPMIAKIMEWGGDVIKFAGDAIFAVFETEAHKSVENAVAAACLAARKMVKFSLRNAVSGVELEVHCGVGVGRVVGLHVGGVLNRWEYAITGDPLHQVTIAEKAAHAGEVVVSEAVHKYVEGFSELELIESDVGGPNLYRVMSMLGEELGTSQLRTHRCLDDLIGLNMEALNQIYLHLVSYVPRPVIQSLNDGGGVVLVDVRKCVTLFVKIKGLPFDKKGDVARVHNAVKMVQKQMYSFKGSTLCRLIIDDKGLSSLWAFGMPPYDMDQNNESEDNFSFRAILAALSLNTALNERGLSCSVGITVGRVFCGTVGGDKRCEYTLHGTQVNLAARLMGLADGILVDETVYNMTKDMVAFGKPVMAKVKGKDHEVKVFKPLGLTPSFMATRPNIHNWSSIDQEKAEAFQTIDQLSEQILLSITAIDEEDPSTTEAPVAIIAPSDATQDDNWNGMRRQPKDSFTPVAPDTRPRTAQAPTPAPAILITGRDKQRFCYRLKRKCKKCAQRHMPWSKCGGGGGVVGGKQALNVKGNTKLSKSLGTNKATTTEIVTLASNRDSDTASMKSPFKSSSNNNNNNNSASNASSGNSQGKGKVGVGFKCAGCGSLSAERLASCKDCGGHRWIAGT